MLKPDIFDKIKGLEERIKSLEGGNQNRNIVIPTGGKFTIDSETSDPTIENGRIYYNSTTKKLRQCIDGAWVDLTLGYVPSASSSATNSVTCLDSRNTNDTPQSRARGLYVDFKANSTDGLSDGGNYHGVLTFRQYGATSDWSGGGVSQLAFTDNGNIWVRRANADTTWGAWKKVTIV